MTTYRYLDASTAHLTEREMKTITEAPPRVIEHEHGAWVYVGRDDLDDQVADGDWEGFPNLLAIVRHAASLGDDVFWINLDADAEEVEGLPSFDWDEPA